MPREGCTCVCVCDQSKEKVRHIICLKSLSEARPHSRPSAAFISAYTIFPSYLQCLTFFPDTDFKLPSVSSVWRAASRLLPTDYPNINFIANRVNHCNFSRVVIQVLMLLMKLKTVKAPQAFWHMDFYLCFLTHKTIQSSAVAVLKKQKKK